MCVREREITENNTFSHLENVIFTQLLILEPGGLQSIGVKAKSQTR